MLSLELFAKHSLHLVPYKLKLCLHQITGEFAKQNTYDDIPNSMKLFIPFCRFFELQNTKIILDRIVLEVKGILMRTPTV